MKPYKKFIKTKKYKNSYGIVCFRKNKKKNSLEYLMNCKKFSYSYTDFILGNYKKITDFDYLIDLFDRMTLEEKEKIKNNDFDTLWSGIWNSKTFKNGKYNESKMKFNIIKSGIKFNSYRNFSLDNLIGQKNSNYTEPEWGFPKGRKNRNEFDAQCALREFTEETGIEKEDFRFVEIDPVYENHIGKDSCFYKTYLYFGECRNGTKTEVHDKVEISQVKWMTKGELIKRLRPYQSSIVNCINIVESRIVEYKEKMRQKKKLEKEEEAERERSRIKNELDAENEKFNEYLMKQKRKVAMEKEQSKREREKEIKLRKEEKRKRKELRKLQKERLKMNRNETEDEYSNFRLFFKHNDPESDED